MFGPDALANFFMSVFLFGLIFTTVSLVLGFAHVGGPDGHDLTGHAGHVASGGHGGHAHAGERSPLNLGHHLSGHAEIAGHDGPDILNMPTLMAFLTWFGGAGYIFRQTLGLVGFFAVPMAMLSGLLGGGIMFVLLARFLWPMMSKPLSTADFSLPGTPARVVSPIRAGGVGEIVYTKGGTRFTAGARSTGDEAISRGTEVVILRYERGLAYVQDVHAILAGVREESTHVG